MTLAELVPGLEVMWAKVSSRGGYGFVMSVPARVVAIGKTRVRIELETKAKAGDRVIRSVMPGSLCLRAPRRDVLSRLTRLEERVDALAEHGTSLDVAARLDGHLRAVADLLRAYTFVAVNEAELQAAVAKVIASHPGLGLLVDRELVRDRDRYDIVLREPDRPMGPLIVLELKIRGSAPAVERQAQRYALGSATAAVVVVTTSNRLAAQLRPGTLGGKPFRVIALRTSF